MDLDWWCSRKGLHSDIKQKGLAVVNPFLLLNGDVSN